MKTAIKEWLTTLVFISGLVAVAFVAFGFLASVFAMVFGDADDLTLIAGFESGAMEGTLDVEDMSAAEVNGVLDAINDKLSDDPDYYGLILNDTEGNLVASRIDNSPEDAV